MRYDYIEKEKNELREVELLREAVVSGSKAEEAFQVQANGLYGLLACWTSLPLAHRAASVSRLRRYSRLRDISFSLGCALKNRLLIRSILALKFVHSEVF